MKQEGKPFRVAVVAFEFLQPVCHRLPIHLTLAFLATPDEKDGA